MHRSILKNLHIRPILGILSHCLITKKLCTDPGRILVPPIPKDLNTASFGQLKQYSVYLMDTLRRFSESPLLDSDDRHLAEDRAEYIKDMLGAHPLRADLIRTIAETEKGTLRFRIKRL